MSTSGTEAHKRIVDYILSHPELKEKLELDGVPDIVMGSIKVLFCGDSTIESFTWTIIAAILSSNEKLMMGLIRSIGTLELLGVAQLLNDVGNGREVQ